MRTDELDYNLPEDLIAQTPTSKRHEARLLVVRLQSDRVEHYTVADLPDLLTPGDLLVLNQTQVLPARFFAMRKKTQGRVEGLFLETRDDRHWVVMLKSGGKLVAGERITLDEHHELELLEKMADASWVVCKHGELDTYQLLDKIGSMPLPPYIQKQRQSNGLNLEQLDRKRYQTVYATDPGAVAAPTAGLHFTESLLDQIHEAKIESAKLTLHVGPGTFQPVRAETLDEHEMHSEWFSVPSETLSAIAKARRQGRRIIPVGTTSVRSLESLPTVLPTDDYAAETELLIQPGYEFRFADGLMTNFHLPKSTLLALVGALTGLDRLKEIYQIAIDKRYRFYSYGDAMLILP